jgi:hypothetical protein
MSHCSLLKAACLEYLHVCCHFFQFVGTELQKVAGSSTVPASRPLVVPYLIWEGACSITEPCHFVFWSLIEDPTVSFTTSSPKVCLKASLNVFLPPSSGCCFMPLPVMSLLNALLGPLQTWFPCSAGKARWVSGVGELLQGLSIICGLCFQLVAVPYGQALIPRSVFSCPHSLLICCSFRDFSVELQKPSLAVW